MNEPTLQEWNWHILMLGQAMVGSISNNFRMISLFWKNNSWMIEFILKKECGDDREEIEEIVNQLSHYLMDIEEYLSHSSGVKIKYIIVVSEKPLRVEPVPYGRVIFKKREV